VVSAEPVKCRSGGSARAIRRQSARRDRGGVGAAVAAPRNIMVEVFYFKAWLQFLVSAFAMQQLDLDTRSSRDGPQEESAKDSLRCSPKAVHSSSFSVRVMLPVAGYRSCFLHRPVTDASKNT